MNRIIVVTSEFGKQGGGLSNSCYKFVQLLKSIGFEVKVVISTYSSENMIEHGIDGCEILVNSIHVAKGGYKSDLYKHLFFRAHVSNVYEQINDVTPIAIIAFGGGENSLFASEINKHLNTKLIIMLRGSEINLSISDPSLFHANYESLKNGHVIVGLTQELIDRAKHIYFNPNSKYLIIPNSIDFKEHVSTNRNDNSVVIGVGARNINEKKGIANLIHALSHLNDKSNVNFKLKIAGEIDNDLQITYNELASSLNVNSDIKFLGNLTKEVFYHEMVQWDLVVQSSFCEGFSNTIGEAVGIGKPFMTTNTGFIAEKIKDKFPSLVFDNFSPEHISDKILKTYNSGKLKQLSIEVADCLKPLVNHDTVKQQWASLFNKISSNEPQTIISNKHIISLIMHDVSEQYYGSVDVPRTDLESFCKLIYDKGYSFVSAKMYFDSEKKDNLIICTFDDAYQDVYDMAYPIFTKYNFTATVFVCSNYVGQDNSWNHKDKKNRIHLNLWKLKELENRGWEIGSHGTNHMSLLRLSTDEIIKDLARSKQFLEKHFNKIVSYAYPYGDYNEHVANLAKQFYVNIFAVDKGGTHIEIDRKKIRRYTIDELSKILKL